MLIVKGMDVIIHEYRIGTITLVQAVEAVALLVGEGSINDHLTQSTQDQKAFLRLCLYELAYQKSIDLTPETAGKCDLVKDRVDRYLTLLNRVDVDLADTVRDVLRQTVYLSFNETRDLLHRALDSLTQTLQDKPFVIVVLDNDRYGSEQWVIQLAWPWLRRLAIQGVYDYNESHSWPTSVWLDDAVYSGGNLMEILSQQVASYFSHDEPLDSANRVEDIHIVLAAANRSSIQHELDAVGDSHKAEGIWYGSRITPHIGMLIDPLDTSPEDSVLNRYLWHGLY